MTLSVVPYYNRPTQEGMYPHFKAIAAAVDIPMILYNVPGRTVADMSNDTALRLAELPNIVGIKDATGNLGAARTVGSASSAGLCLVHRRRCYRNGIHVARRAWCDHRDRQRGTKGDGDLCQRSLAGDITGAVAINDAFDGAAQAIVHRGQSDPGQMGRPANGTDRPRDPFAIDTPQPANAKEAVRQAMQQGGVAFLARC